MTCPGSDFDFAYCKQKSAKGKQKESGVFVMINYIYKKGKQVSKIIKGFLYMSEHYEDNLHHYFFLSLVYTYTVTLFNFC